MASQERRVRPRGSSSDGSHNKPSSKKSCNLITPADNELSAEEDISAKLENVLQRVRPEKKKAQKGESRNELQDMIQAAVNNAITALIPIIKSIVEESLEKKVKQLSEEVEQAREELKQERVKNRMAMDKMEQYSRRDNLVISGIREKKDETTEELRDSVLEVCKIISAQVTPDSIAAVHRLGRWKEGKTRPVIIRTTRIAKEQICRKKKGLRDNQSLVDNNKLENKVYINEDITESRRKLLQHIRSSRSVDFCFVREGTIVCKKGSSFVHVNDADDLFKLGAEDVEYADFYKL